MGVGRGAEDLDFKMYVVRLIELVIFRVLCGLIRRFGYFFEIK